MTDQQEIEWPDEIWADDHQDSNIGIYRLATCDQFNEPIETAKYVHHGIYDRLQKYHDTMVASLRARIYELENLLPPPPA